MHHHSCCYDHCCHLMAHTHRGHEDTKSTFPAPNDLLDKEPSAAVTEIVPNITDVLSSLDGDENEPFFIAGTAVASNDPIFPQPRLPLTVMQSLKKSTISEGSHVGSPTYVPCTISHEEVKAVHVHQNVQTVPPFVISIQMLILGVQRGIRHMGSIDCQSNIRDPATSCELFPHGPHTRWRRGITGQIITAQNFTNPFHPLPHVTFHC